MDEDAPPERRLLFDLLAAGRSSPLGPLPARRRGAGAQGKAKRLNAGAPLARCEPWARRKGGPPGPPGPRSAGRDSVPRPLGEVPARGSKSLSDPRRSVLPRVGRRSGQRRPPCLAHRGRARPGVARTLQPGAGVVPPHPHPEGTGARSAPLCGWPAPAPTSRPGPPPLGGRGGSVSVAGSLACLARVASAPGAGEWGLLLVPCRRKGIWNFLTRRSPEISENETWLQRKVAEDAQWLGAWVLMPDQF